jgi:hypothetical protein
LNVCELSVKPVTALRAQETAALYFSGTGNTRFALRCLAKELGLPNDRVISIESGADAVSSAAAKAQTLIIAYPNYMCVLPKIMADFLTQNRQLFADKSIITLVTYANFCFDADLLAPCLPQTESGNGGQAAAAAGPMQPMLPLR